jgi:hypothetical protein
MSYLHFAIDSGNLAGKIQNTSHSKVFHLKKEDVRAYMFELTQAQKYAHLEEPEYMNIFFWPTFHLDDETKFEIPPVYLSN